MSQLARELNEMTRQKLKLKSGHFEFEPDINCSRAREQDHEFFLIMKYSLHIVISNLIVLKSISC